MRNLLIFDKLLQIANPDFYFLMIFQQFNQFLGIRIPIVIRVKDFWFEDSLLRIYQSPTHKHSMQNRHHHK